MDRVEAARNALSCVLEARAGESLTVVCDEELEEVGRAFSSAALELGLWTRFIELPRERRPRKGVPPLLEAAVISDRPDIFMNVLRGGAEETPFRIQLIGLERRRRVRLGHCPGITMDMLTDGALALSERDYVELQARAQELMRLCQGAVALRVTCPEGTDLRLSVEGREFFTDTRLNWETLKWMNLPVGEVIVGPVETSADGVLVCASAIGGIGLIEDAVRLEVRGGRVVRVQCPSAALRKRIERVQATDPWARCVGEFAVGLNKKARIMREFLETEKVDGTAHVAFGNNSDYPGGKNLSRTHQDFLITRPTVILELGSGGERVLLREGRFSVKGF
ncbi:MAG: aminopeptidase [Thermoplasmata archaeon]